MPGIDPTSNSAALIEGLAFRMACESDLADRAGHPTLMWLARQSLDALGVELADIDPNGFPLFAFTKMGTLGTITGTGHLMAMFRITEDLGDDEKNNKREEAFSDALNLLYDTEEVIGGACFE